MSARFVADARVHPLRTLLSFDYAALSSQVSKVCEELQGMPELTDGFNAVGFSQGGQFLRVNHEPIKRPECSNTNLTLNSCQQTGQETCPVWDLWCLPEPVGQAMCLAANSLSALQNADLPTV